MAEPIIAQRRVSSPQEPQDWESHFYREACARAREEAVAYLARLDEQLLAQKPAGWQVVGKRARKVVTRFGEVCVQRRLYRDEQGEGRFLLDEVIGVPWAGNRGRPSTKPCVRGRWPRPTPYGPTPGRSRANRHGAPGPGWPSTWRTPP